MIATAIKNQVLVQDPAGVVVLELSYEDAHAFLQSLEKAMDEAGDYRMTWRDYADQGRYSDSQKQFCQDMEAMGWGRYIRPDYSGRGMYGEICPGIVTRSDWDKEDQFDADDVVRATDVGLSRDSMGLETILYCRG